jgi:hypothetical protein
MKHIHRSYTATSEQGQKITGYRKNYVFGVVKFVPFAKYFKHNKIQDCEGQQYMQHT